MSEQSESSVTHGPVSSRKDVVAGAAGDSAATPGFRRVPEPVPDAPAVFWLAHYSYRELVRRRRLISLTAMMALPILLVVALRLWYHGPVLTPHLLLASLGFHFYLPFLVPVVALAVGVSAIGEQIAEGTLIYPWSRPVRRGAIYVGRVLAAQLIGATLLVLSLVGCFLAMTLGAPGSLSLALIKLYVGTTAVLVLGAFAYTAIFALVGTLIRRPIFVCILFAFGWDSAIGRIPERIREYSLAFHLRNLIERPDVPATQDLGGFFEEIVEQLLQTTPVPEWRSLLVVLALIALATLFGMRALGSKEIA